MSKSPGWFISGVSALRDHGLSVRGVWPTFMKAANADMRGF